MSEQPSSKELVNDLRTYDPREMPNWCEDRMLQSADEIERLAKHSANVEEQYSNYHEWATAEIERLTESLRQREDQLRISLDEQRASTPPAAELAAGIEWLKQEICDGEEYLQRYPNSVDELAQQEHRQRLLDAITGSAQPPAVALRSILRKYICDCRNESTDDPDKHGVHCRYHIEMRAVLTKEESQ